MSYVVKADTKNTRINLQNQFRYGQEKAEINMALEHDFTSTKKVIGTQLSVKTPFQYLQKLKTDLKYEYYFYSLLDFHLKEIGAFEYNTLPKYDWENLASIQDGEITYSSKINENSAPWVAFEAAGKIQKSRLGGKLSFQYKNESPRELTTDLKHELPEFSMLVKFDPAFLAPLPIYIESDSAIEIKATNKKTAEGVFETDVLAKSGKDRIRLTNKLEYSASKKSTDMFLSYGDAPAQRFSWSLEQMGSREWEMKGLVKWGDQDEFANLNGKFSKPSRGAYEALLTVEAPSIDPRKYELTFSKKQGEGNGSFMVKLEADNASQGFVE